MHVLLVDDEALIRWSLRKALTARGHEVTEAKCGDEALTLLRTHHYDVVLTDLKLPGPDGFKVIEAARALSPDIPVIMMSAHGNRDIREQIAAYRIDHFLDKPLVVDDVARLVENLLETGKS